MANVDGDFISGQSPVAAELLDGLGGDIVSGQAMESGATLSGFSSGATGAIYEMRAQDGSLGHPVFWTAGLIDTTGAFYTGPGPLTDVVVFKIVG